MAISRFFVARPIFAWVIAIVVMMAGAGSIARLAVEQYPDIAPPQVSVRASYPGASAETLESSVTQILEQQLTGIDGLLYFSSSSDSSGSASVNITFAKGTNPDTAQVQVQNRVQQALARLPAQVQQEGLSVTKQDTGFLLVVSLFDASDRASDTDVSDYLVSNFQDDLARVQGVGRVQVFGSEYAMRIWLDPVKLAAVKLMPADITQAIQAQNTEVSAGQIGLMPAVPGQMLNAVVKAKSRFTDPAEFRDIVVKTLSDGSVVRLEEVARVELGQDDYSSFSRHQGHPASGLAIELASGADALQTATAIKARVAELSKEMPSGYEVAFEADTTDFIKLSVREVLKTLAEAIFLVIVVMFVFLQSARATLIPAIAVPVVLLGTLGVLAAFGYSINTLTLFGMVLAIGLLVDDAIVVVENVERIMAEEKLDPHSATLKSMDEIGSALVGIGLVLSAVFLPMAFFGGSTGVIYRQFSITIITSMALSVLVALILSPALCATLLKPGQHNPLARTGAFGSFNRRFHAATERYVRMVQTLIRGHRGPLLSYTVIVLALVLLFVRLPTGFVPLEDEGQVMADFQLPAGATFARTGIVQQEIERHFLHNEPDVQDVFTISGWNFNGTGQNAGMAFISLKPFEQRHGAQHSAEAVANRAKQAFASARDAEVFASLPPVLSGIGESSGFSLELLNINGMARSQFVALRDKLIAAANRNPKLAQVRASILPDTPQLRVNLDERKLAVLGLAESDVLNTLSSAWGSSYVGDFVDRGRVKRVYVQSDAPYRMLPSDLDNWFVRAASTNTMVPFSAFASTSWETGPTSLSRFNGRSSYGIQGQPAAGVSSGEAMKEMETLRERLAPGTGLAWSGLSYQEQQSKGQAPYLYALSVLIVFLCLAALYESWSIPVAVLLALPLGIIGAVLAVALRGLENDIYFQVGLVTTIGLTAKNAILIVEFAELARRKGEDATEAILQAARLRLRPILMTSIAFIVGVLPLAIATGAGARSRVAIGTAVTGGMLTATTLTLFFVPFFFLLVVRLSRWRLQWDAKAARASV